MFKIEITGATAAELAANAQSISEALNGNGASTGEVKTTSTKSTAAAETKGKGKVEAADPKKELAAIKKKIIDVGTDFRPTAQAVLKRYKAVRTDDLDPSDYESFSADIDTAIVDFNAGV